MYEQYVDDINMVISEDQAINADKRTLLIQVIESDIHSSIQLEVDFPLNHEDGKMPIFDLKVWIEKHETHTVIMHELYSKEVTSKNV